MLYENISPIKQPLTQDAQAQTRSSPSPLQCNARDVAKDLAWCEQLIDLRIKLYFDQQTPHNDVFDLPPPDMTDNSDYADFIRRHRLDFSDRLTLVLALLPAVKPQLLDIFLVYNETTHQPYAEFGCQQLDGHHYATGETLAFLLGGDALEQRLLVQIRLQQTRSPQTGSPSQQKAPIHQLLYRQPDSNDPLAMKTPLRLTPEYQHLFTTAQPYRPDLSEDFPARRVDTKMDWDDLVLQNSVMEQLQEILGWIKHGTTLMQDWGLGKKLRPGYRALFYGPPGTGKTLTACVLAKTTGRDVYRVDLSLIVSKYVGETEKNMEKVFSLAEDKSWILFFDEADALFGKRIQTASSNDQFANQNVAYLLQRIELFNGIIILASNFKDNLDEAFFRRFESIIYFPLPSTEQRLQLWREGFSKKSRLAAQVDLPAIAKQHKLTGATIMNVIRYVSLKALSKGGCEISADDITQGIRRETAHTVTPRW